MSATASSRCGPRPNCWLRTSRQRARPRLTAQREKRPQKLRGARLLEPAVKLGSVVAGRVAENACAVLDAALAETNRRKLYDQLAADKMRMQGFHFPFPAVGYIEKDGQGYRYTPAPWNPVV